MNGTERKALDTTSAIRQIQRFLHGNLLASGMSGYVVGLSGGVDSATSATLAVKAVGKDKVLGLLLPFRNSSPESQPDAMAIVEQLRIAHRNIDISPMIDAYFPAIDDELRIRAGNKMARERMSVLFDVAHETSRLVLGTGNRTEICLGYTTWYGDAACSVNPVGDLYKTELRRVATEIGVPQGIIDKAPSADLWAGQTDEGELGLSYEVIDRLLVRIVDEQAVSIATLESEGFATEAISRVVSLLNLNAFKRRSPAIAPLGRLPIPDHIALEP